MALPIAAIAGIIGAGATVASTAYGIYDRERQSDLQNKALNKAVQANKREQRARQAEAAQQTKSFQEQMKLLDSLKISTQAYTPQDGTAGGGINPGVIILLVVGILIIAS